MSLEQHTFVAHVQYQQIEHVLRKQARENCWTLEGFGHLGEICTEAIPNQGVVQVAEGDHRHGREMGTKNHKCIVRREGQHGEECVDRIYGCQRYCYGCTAVYEAVSY